MEEKNFKERYLAGEIEFEEIDRYISRWNNSDDERTLAKYLGLNEEEEDVWIDESDEALRRCWIVRKVGFCIEEGLTGRWSVLFWGEKFQEMETDLYFGRLIENGFVIIRGHMFCQFFFLFFFFTVFAEESVRQRLG